MRFRRCASAIAATRTVRHLNFALSFVLTSCQQATMGDSQCQSGPHSETRDLRLEFPFSPTLSSPLSQAQLSPLASNYSATRLLSAWIARARSRCKALRAPLFGRQVVRSLAKVAASDARAHTTYTHTHTQEAARRRNKAGGRDRWGLKQGTGAACCWPGACSKRLECADWTLAAAHKQLGPNQVRPPQAGAGAKVSPWSR